jgi:hypothetical protein
VREQAQLWLAEKMKTAGILACGLRAPDRKTFIRSQSPQFTQAALEQACRCLSDTFQVLHANRFPLTLIRWVYENYFLYGSMREDGICFAVLTHREGGSVQPADLEQIIAEFQALQA